MTAEDLDFPPESFDLVVGAYILHHVEIEVAAFQISRVLKPGGKAFFLEWVDWPPFDRLRSASRRFVSTREGEDATEDERKMSDQDLQLLSRYFRHVRVDRAYTLARPRFFSKKLYVPMAKADHRLYQKFPSFRRTGGRAIVALEK